MARRICARRERGSERHPRCCGQKRKMNLPVPDFPGFARCDHCDLIQPIRYSGIMASEEVRGRQLHMTEIVCEICRSPVATLYRERPSATVIALRARRR